MVNRQFKDGTLLVAFVAGAMVALGADLPPETERLVSTGRLWITVKYFHPPLGYRNLDWNQALVEALPKIRTAQTSADYETAVRSMMSVLEGAPVASGSGQRVWIHHGLAPETDTGVATPFYSAFLYKPGNTVEEVNVPMGGFSVRVAVSEPAGGAAAIPMPPPERFSVPPYPSTEWRILAAYKIWGALHYFFAYRDLIDEDWDALLPQFLPRMIAAKDALEYNLTIADWLTHAADTFTIAHSKTLEQYFGEAAVGLRVRIVEKHVTVTQVLDAEAAKEGIKVGDIVKKVDGETLVDRFKRESQYVSASTAQRQGFDVVQKLLDGADGSTAQLTIEDSVGNRKEVSLKRSQQFKAVLHAETGSGDVIKFMRGGIGYADLTRLRKEEVDGMFEKFARAPAIIFDMRGIPTQDTFTMIASRLGSEPETPATIVTGPVLIAPDLSHDSITSTSSSYFFMQTLGPSTQKKFPGKTVMLVDERTIADGELAGLYLEAANRTEFVGAPSAGAYSVLSDFSLPGGVTVSFSGEDIRHGNGGKLQRLGLQPNLTVAPTVPGIRAGKDEILEKALDYLLPKATVPAALPTRAGTALLGL